MAAADTERSADLAEKIVAGLCVLAVAVGMVWAVRHQRFMEDTARLEQEGIDRAGVIGWVRLDQETKQLYFVGR